MKVTSKYEKDPHKDLAAHTGHVKKIAVFLAVLCVAGCQERLDPKDPKDPTDPTAPTEQESTTLDGRLVEILSTQYSDPDSLMSAPFSPDTPVLNTLKELLTPLYLKSVQERKVQLDRVFQSRVGLTPDGHRQWRVESHYFTYRTQSARGEDIVLSGRVIFPNNTVEGVPHSVKALILESHQAGDAGITSETQRELKSLLALSDAAIILPDFQGYGTTLGQETYCFVSSEVLARQLADCTLAALDVMSQRDVTLAPYGYTLNQGESQGAVVPIAFARWYETKAPQSFKDQIRLRATLSALGPQDFAAMTWYLSDHQENNAILVARIAVSLPALSEQMLEGYAATDFYSDAVKNTMVESMPYYEAAGKHEYNIFGTEKDAPKLEKLAEILAPDMLTENGRLDAQSPKTQAFMRILAQQNPLTDWTPSLPIYFVSCPQDDAITHEISHDTYRTLSAYGSNPSVHWGNLQLPPLSAAILSKIPLATHIVPTFILRLRLNTSDYYKDLVSDWEN